MWVAEPRGTSAINLEVCEPEVVFVAVFFVAVVSVALVSAADAAEPLVSGNIPVVVVAFVPAPVLWVEAYSPEHSRFLPVSANVYLDATFSNSPEVDGWVFVRSSNDAHANHDPCSILSSLGLH